MFGVAVDANHPGDCFVFVKLFFRHRSNFT
jgi:hypothetical protein